MKLTYAQQVELADKAVRVCQSVIRYRQTGAALNYAKLVFDLLHRNRTGLKYLFVGSVAMNSRQWKVCLAVDRMYRRLSTKPRYRLTTTGWVRWENGRLLPLGNY